jgi:predicted phage terminase large subunit-like protein
MFNKSKLSGKLDAFYQELMLRITSDEEKLIRRTDIKPFDYDDVMSREYNYNFYITTDFATSLSQKSDFTVISVWAYNSKGDWMLIDGSIGRELVDKTIDRVFDFVTKYNVKSVGIEVTGQQGGFATWVSKEMHTRNQYFTLVEVRPTKDKMSRFHTVLPLFKQGKIWFSKDLLGTEFMSEAYAELDRATVSGFKSKKDDFIDTVSMLAYMKPWKPASGSTPRSMPEYEDPYHDEYKKEPSEIGSYIV